MKISTNITNKGITIRIGEEAQERLTLSPSANQENPKCYYVYGHYDKQGVPFYIGKGTKRRAWDEDRHSLWHRYVQKHLNGEYTVVILVDDLNSAQAEELESEWVAQESETLLNWVNFSRKTDFSALNTFHKLCNANQELLGAAREQEQSNPDEAIKLYFKALANIEAYATIQPKMGLVGQLIDEERKENGINGELPILDRLTLCLIRANRQTEASELTRQYFAMYRADEELSAAIRIKMRVRKGDKKEWLASA
ncbi:hypothetical protein [Nitrosomonas communis]|uniref:hypothetical protein n=1 Tax=Nitrosomonas communis TaxID=44574 RepID=UPI0026EF8256|nr:hypothetical protein [Nitrosomonas communis]MCO6427692.1 hypothetical protein [Nitrosomonas communis]